MHCAHDHTKSLSVEILLWTNKSWHGRTDGSGKTGLRDFTARSGNIRVRRISEGRVASVTSVVPLSALSRPVLPQALSVSWLNFLKIPASEEHQYLSPLVLFGIRGLFDQEGRSDHFLRTPPTLGAESTCSHWC